MSGRRQDQRYFVPDSEAVLRVTRDVVIHWVGRDEVIAVSTQPAKPGEWLTVESVDRDNGRKRMRVMACEPFMLGAVLRYRLLLERPRPNRGN